MKKKKKELADSNRKICKGFDFLSVLWSKKKSVCVRVCEQGEGGVDLCGQVGVECRSDRLLVIRL